MIPIQDQTIQTKQDVPKTTTKTSTKKNGENERSHSNNQMRKRQNILEENMGMERSQPKCRIDKQLGHRFAKSRRRPLG